MRVCAYVCVYFHNPSITSRVKSILKRDRAGLNSEFCFSYSGCLANLKNLVRTTIYPLLWGGETGSMLFSIVNFI